MSPVLAHARETDEPEAWLLKKSNRLLEAVVAILDVAPDVTTAGSSPPSVISLLRRVTN